MEDLTILSEFNTSFEELISQLDEVIEGKIDFVKLKELLNVPFSSMGQLFHKIHVQSISELLAKFEEIGKNSRQHRTQAQELIEEYFGLEKDWDSLIDRVDRYKEKLAEIKCRVIVIGYGEIDNGILWKDKLKFPFDVYVDKDRKLFKYFKMARSFNRVGKMDNIYNYVENFVMKNIPQIESFYKDEDPLQEGGDIIFNTDGQNVFEYVSIATNRPKVQDVIEFVQKFTK